MEDHKLKYPEWQVPLQEVVLESDLDQLPRKIERLESVIFERLQQLCTNAAAAPEKQAIDDALKILRSVQRERLNYPDWKSPQSPQ
jgi:hypothetical protein